MFWSFVSPRRILVGAALLISLIAVGSAAYALGPIGSSSGGSSSSKTPVVKLSTAAAPVAVAPVAAAPAPVATTSTAAAKPVNDKPSFIVASSALNRIVLIDSITGKTTKVLADYGSQGEDSYCLRPGAIYIDPTSGISMSPDGQTVYFVRSPASTGNPDTCPFSTEIWKVSVDGTGLSKVADGTQPVVSADGTKLAYYFVQDDVKADGSGQNIQEVHVLDLTTNKNTVVQSLNDCGCGANLAWAPDNRHMVLQTLNCGCGDMVYNDAHIIDTTVKDDKGVLVPRPSGTSGAEWGPFAYLPNGDLFTVKNIVYTDGSGNQINQNVPPSMDVIDPTTGKVIKTVATGYTDRGYTSPSADKSGNHLLYLSNNNIMVSDNGGRAVQLATGVVAADWK